MEYNINIKKKEVEGYQTLNCISCSFPGLHKFPYLQVHPEGKYVVDIDKNIDITKITPSTRVALRNDSYVLHLILPSKVDPLVNLMKVEKVPDSTYDMIGGLDQQIKEIKEVSGPKKPYL